MASPESSREPTLTDVLHAVTLVAEEMQSLRRVVQDEFAALRHHLMALDTRIMALDRDVQGVVRWIGEQDG